MSRIHVNNLISLLLHMRLIGLVLLWQILLVGLYWPQYNYFPYSFIRSCIHSFIIHSVSQLDSQSLCRFI